MKRFRSRPSTKAVAVALCVDILVLGCRPKMNVPPVVASAPPSYPQAPPDVGRALRKITAAFKAAEKPVRSDAPKLTEEVKEVTGFETFCRLFYRRTGTDFPTWQKEAESTLAQLDKTQTSPRLVAPKASDLVALLDELASHPERHTDAQQKALASANEKLGQYLRCLDNADDNQPGVKQLIDGLASSAVTFQNSIETVNAVAKDLKTKTGAAARAAVESLFADGGTVHTAINSYHEAAKSVVQVSKAAEAKVDESTQLRKQLEEALASLKALVNEPRLDGAIDKLVGEERSFLDKVADVVKWLHPVFWLLALLSLLFGGGQGGNGNGGNNGNQAGNDSNRPTGGNQDQGDNSANSGKSVGSDAGKIPPKSKPLDLLGPDDGSFVVAAYELDGRRFLQIFPKDKPQDATTLKFDLPEYPADRFGELATVFSAGKLKAETAFMQTPFPVVVVFGGTTTETALRWEAADSEPVIVGGPPVPLAADETNVPIQQPPGDGTLWVYLVRKQPEERLLIRIFDSNADKKPGKKLVELDFDGRELCRPGEEMLLTIQDGIGIRTDHPDDPYPVTITFGCADGETKELIWAAKGRQPTVQAGTSNKPEA